MLQINLVGANTKATDNAQLLGRIQDLLGQLGLGSDTDTVHILDLLNQHILGQGLRMGLDLMGLC